MEISIVTVGLAFAAGFLSFLSPCVLPLVPGYISLISGISIDRLKEEGGSLSAARRAVIKNSIAFNIGLSMIFLTLGAAAGLLGSSITSNPWLRIIGGVVIIAFGFQLIGLLKIGALYKDTRMFSQQKPRGMLGSLMLGMAFAAGWTPCIGPILGGILGLAATSGGWKSGLMLSAFYAAGLSVPFLVTGLSINHFLGFYAKFRRHLHKVEVVSGCVLILIGLAVALNLTTRLSSAITWIPNAEALIKLDTKTNMNAAAPASNQTDFKPAPEVTLHTADGKAFRLSDLRGQVVLLNFWATWCVPCRAEIPAFNAMQQEHEARGLKVVGVLTQDSPDNLKDFQKEIKQNYTVLLGDEDVGPKFGNGQGLPITIIIDREGRIRQKIMGGNERAAFEAAIKPLLDEAQTTAQNN
jgi:cytochrome c-type biogenesis protein